MRLIDTHAHLNLPEFKKDLQEVLDRAVQAGIIKIVVIGIDRKTGEKALELKAMYPHLIEVALGFHPHEVKKLKEEDYQWLEKNISQAIAIGEIGLDFVKEYSPRDEQIKHLERLLELAKRFQKPVILHLRGDISFWNYALHFLENFRDLPFLFHCFTADQEVAFKILNFNSLISLPGVLTYNNAENLRKAAKAIPLERLVLETDCPFLSPMPMRGKRNEPAFLLYTAQKLAEIKKLSFEEVAEITTKNALNFLGL